MGLVRGEHSGKGAVLIWEEPVGLGYLFMAIDGAKPCSGTIRSDLRNTVAPDCKHCGHDGLAPKNYFHGRCTSPVSELQQAMPREIVASPSGSSVKWLLGDAFADRHRRRVAEDYAGGTRE